MNRIALLAALIAAAVGALLLYLYLERFEEEKSGGPPVMVATANQDVPLGAVLTQEMIGSRPLPRNYVEPRRHIKQEDIEDILGVRVSMSLRAGESILWTDLSTTSQERRDLQGLIGNGMRAMTITAGVNSTFGGLLRPGNRVDVLLTARRGGAGGERVTIPLLQNVIVLAMGSDTGDPDEPQGSRETGEVTVSVTPIQAQIMTHANESGDLTLTLRQNGEIAEVEGLPEITQNDILQAERRRRYAPAAPPQDTGPTLAEPIR